MTTVRPTYGSSAADKRSVAAIGDVADVRAWSGIPFHFLEAARAADFASVPWRLHLPALRNQRLRWNLWQVLRGRQPGGFQYSAAFARAAGAQVPEKLFSTEIISFNQHFPPAVKVAAAGGILNHYIDATFASLSAGQGLDLRLPCQVAEEGRQAERENYQYSRRIVAMARWTAESLVVDCGVDPAKIAVILPGANYTPPADQEPPTPQSERAGRERDFVLGFVGMDWRRKGLDFLVEVRDLLATRGWRVSVHAAGATPPELQNRVGVRLAGRIEKDAPDGGFVRFLAGCDLGCLFSRGEALGISTLEFLRAGLPVAGFAHQGLRDTLPPDAGFRFTLEASAEEVAAALDSYLRDEGKQAAFRRAASDWAPMMTWERCIMEIKELWQTGTIRNPVRVWKGLRRIEPVG